MKNIQTSIFDASTVANFVANGQMFGAALTAFGWTKVTDPAQVVWANINSLNFMPFSRPATLTSVASPGIAPWASGVNYTGVSVTSNGSYSIVTQGGITYACIATHTSSGGNQPPNTSFWIPYAYEIWQSTGPASTIFPIYLKITYGASGAFPNTPMFNMDVASAFSPGQLGGNRMGETPIGWNATTGNGSLQESDFSGDADTFGFMLYRTGLQTVSAQMVQVFYIDRSRDNTANVLPTYAQVAIASTAGSLVYATIFRSGAGGVILTSGGYWITIGTQNSTFAYNGLAPVLPCFAIPGFVSNPVQGVVTMRASDFNDSTLVNAVLLGSSHTYLMSRSHTVDPSSTVYPGIRWE